MNNLRDNLATEFANRGNTALRAPHGKCPRGVVNPGDWYGFVAGWEACLREASPPERELTWIDDLYAPEEEDPYE